MFAKRFGFAKVRRSFGFKKSIKKFGKGRIFPLPLQEYKIGLARDSNAVRVTLACQTSSSDLVISVNREANRIRVDVQR